MEHCTEFCIVTIPRDSMMRFASALPVAHFVDCIHILGHDEIPIAETLLKNLFGFPSEQPLRGWRPAQNSEGVVPFNDCQWSILHMKRQSLVGFQRGFFSALAFCDIANDRNSANNVAMFAVSR